MIQRKYIRLTIGLVLAISLAWWPTQWIWYTARAHLPTTKTYAEILESLAKTAALMAAFAFFCYKALVGYLYGDLTLVHSSERKRVAADKELLVVKSVLKKGGRGSVCIHDLQARITYDTGSETKPFVGFHRLSYKTQSIETQKRRVIDWNSRSRSAPLLRIPPNEEAEFACYFVVPPHSTCTVEVVALGQEGKRGRVGQWRGSHISTPISATTNAKIGIAQ